MNGARKTKTSGSPVRPAPRKLRKPAAAARRSVPRQGGAQLSGSLRGEFVYLELREDIRTGRLSPRDRLRETEIAERLGVSRTPVREALKRLESDGLVSFGQGRGLTVSELTHDQVLELYALREVLEGAAARFAAERASPLQVDTLKQILAQSRGTRSPEDAARANRQLHQGIVAAAHNVYLNRVMNTLSDALALLGATTYAVPGRIESGWKENAEIVDCIARRDPDAAEKAARKHIRAASALRLAITFGKG